MVPPFIALSPLSRSESCCLTLGSSYSYSNEYKSCFWCPDNDHSFFHSVILPSPFPQNEMWESGDSCPACARFKFYDSFQTWSQSPSPQCNCCSRTSSRTKFSATEPCRSIDCCITTISRLIYLFVLPYNEPSKLLLLLRFINSSVFSLHLSAGSSALVCDTT